MPTAVKPFLQLPPALRAQWVEMMRTQRHLLLGRYKYFNCQW